jgi:UbiD family decarboxylase
MEMAVSAVGSTQGTHEWVDVPGTVGPADLRAWIQRVEAAGLLHRVTAEVDWDQEMAAVTYLAQQEIGGPALLFENVKGYGPGHPSLWNPLGSSLDRIALAVGLPTGLRAIPLIDALRRRVRRRIAPVMVDASSAPINENVVTGDRVDVLGFPIPRHWPRDGGRYGGTCDAVLTRDPDGGWINLGTYRMMVHDRNTVGLYLSPGKDARLHLERARALGQDLEVVACWGVHPAMFMVGSQSFPKTCSELDALGGLVGSPVELVPGIAVNLPVPARAEIALEGVIRPGANRLEGPFGEFTGYYGRPEDLAPFIEVRAVHHRHRPIHTNALMADYPACECSTLYAVARAMRVWDDLERVGVPGIRGVYSHPAAAGGFGMTIVSLEQRYAGHAPQVLALAAQCPGGAYYSKWIVAVDEDVDPSDINQVLWAMATRCNPGEDIDILRQTWSTWLDPTQNPPEERPWGSKALINACMEHRYKDVFSPRSRLSRQVYERVRGRWAELGLPGQPPEILALEEDDAGETGPRGS